MHSWVRGGRKSLTVNWLRIWGKEREGAHCFHVLLYTDCMDPEFKSLVLHQLWTTHACNYIVPTYHIFVFDFFFLRRHVRADHVLRFMLMVCFLIVRIICSCCSGQRVWECLMSPIILIL